MKGPQFRLTLTLFFIIFGITLKTVKTEKAILLDTRTALSDLGWTFAAGSEWEEMTSSDRSGEERRMLMVCEIKKPYQDNWMRSQYVHVQGAQRVYVEIEFTIRSCEDVPNVATCKETFNLYYYETDRDEATSTFPPWNEAAYTKVDTVAADQRFQPGSSDTNFETRDIGPITKGGIYLAVQDTGACVALMHVRVYYKYCDVSTRNLATFTRTTTGPEVTSLVEAKGLCVRNAVTESDGIRPSLYCNGKGQWTVPTGTCACTAGYEPNNQLTQCLACKMGYYKSIVANRACRRCPDYSRSNSRAATLCDCMTGYFRAHSDTADVGCTKPSTKPVNLHSKVNMTSVTLTWAEPHNTGGRNDLSYEIRCSKCRDEFSSCVDCDSNLRYYPSQRHLSTTHVTITSLSSYAYYKLKVCAVNGVTSVAMESGKALDNCAELTVETNQAAPSDVVGVMASRVSENSFVLEWGKPHYPNGIIQEYEIVIKHVTDASSSKLANEMRYRHNKTNERQMTVTGLQSAELYAAKVRARTLAGYGPFSASIRVRTTSLSDADSMLSDQNDVTLDQGINVPLIPIAIGGGVAFILLVAIILYCLRKRTKKALKRKKHDPEKHGAIFNGNTVQFNRSLVSGHKTYIDPTTYEDPHRAVREFTKEIDMSFVKIEEVIGGGEFGEVCKGKLHLPTKTEQDVAIKTLKSGYSTQQKLDFLGEASIMGQFDHPNVIRLEGVVTKSRPLMIITEYMENRSLDAYLRNHDNEFSVVQLVGMLRNISAGMKYLSEMGYIHRDLAARNILVNGQLVCKVSDFGMSRVLEDDEDASYTTRGGKIPIRWTAPEAITFQKFTSASDVWSYGIVMWEVMSYGERPYWGMSNQDVIKAVENGFRLPAPMDCPQVQHKLMLECWKQDRNQRPKFAQIVTSLDKVLRNPAQLKIKVTNGRNTNVSTSNVIPGRPIPASLETVKTPLTDNNRSTPIANGSSASYIREESNETLPLLRSDDTDRNSRDQADVTSLGAWLTGVGLPQYLDHFTRNGCTSMEQIVQVSLNNLIEMGIVDESHQEALMSSIKDFGRPSGHQEVALPTYAETFMHPPGIAV